MTRIADDTESIRKRMEEIQQERMNRVMGVAGEEPGAQIVWVEEEEATAPGGCNFVHNLLIRNNYEGLYAQRGNFHNQGLGLTGRPADYTGQSKS